MLYCTGQLLVVFSSSSHTLENSCLIWLVHKKCNFMVFKFNVTGLTCEFLFICRYLCQYDICVFLKRHVLTSVLLIFKYISF